MKVRILKKMAGCSFSKQNKLRFLFALGLSLCCQVSISQESQNELAIDLARVSNAAATAPPQQLHEIIVQYGIMDISAFIPGGKRALIHSAAVNVDYPETLDFLLEAGADANLSDANGLTPLSMAFLYGTATAVAKLLRAGANPESPLADGTSIKAICTEVVERRQPEYLLEKCVSIEAFVSDDFSQEKTVSTNSCLGQYPTKLINCPCIFRFGKEVVDVCEPVLSLENVNLLSKLAARAAPEELSEALQSTGFNDQEDYSAFLDGTGYGLIHAAVANWRHPEMIGFLVERGVDVNARTLSGRSPLVQAIGGSRIEIAIALLAAGADPLLPAKKDGASTFELCNALRFNGGQNKVCDAIDAYLASDTRP